MRKFLAWLGQPTTVAGIATLVGTVAGALSGAMDWQGALPLIVGGIVAMILPDNSGAQITIQHATADVIAAEQAIIKPTTVIGKSV